MGGGDEQAGLPLIEQVLKAAEQADQGGQDEGVQGGKHTSPSGHLGRFDAQVGQEGGQGPVLGRWGMI